MFVTYLIGFVICSFLFSFIDQKFIGIVEDDTIAGITIIGLSAMLWPFAIPLGIAAALFIGPFYFGRKLGKK